MTDLFLVGGKSLVGSIPCLIILYRVGQRAQNTIEGLYRLQAGNSGEARSAIMNGCRNGVGPINE